MITVIFEDRERDVYIHYDGISATYGDWKTIKTYSESYEQYY